MAAGVRTVPVQGQACPINDFPVHMYDSESGVASVFAAMEYEIRSGLAFVGPVNRESKV